MPLKCLWLTAPTAASPLQPGHHFFDHSGRGPPHGLHQHLHSGAPAGQGGTPPAGEGPRWVRAHVQHKPVGCLLALLSSLQAATRASPTCLPVFWCTRCHQQGRLPTPGCLPAGLPKRVVQDAQYLRLVARVQKLAEGQGQGGTSRYRPRGLANTLWGLAGVRGDSRLLAEGVGRLNAECVVDCRHAIGRLLPFPSSLPGTTACFPLQLWAM